MEIVHFLLRKELTSAFIVFITCRIRFTFSLQCDARKSRSLFKIFQTVQIGFGHELLTMLPLLKTVSSNKIASYVSE